MIPSSGNVTTCSIDRHVPSTVSTGRPGALDVMTVTGSNWSSRAIAGNAPSASIDVWIAPDSRDVNACASTIDCTISSTAAASIASHVRVGSGRRPCLPDDTALS
jgi:hypothetical protein